MAGILQSCHACTLLSSICGSMLVTEISPNFLLGSFKSGSLVSTCFMHRYMLFFPSIHFISSKSLVWQDRNRSWLKWLILPDNGKWLDTNEAIHLIRAGHIRKKLVSYNLFACWFQPTLFNQPTVFFSHNKPAPASPNQPRNQPANKPLESRASTFSVVVLVGTKLCCLYLRWNLITLFRIYFRI